MCRSTVPRLGQRQHSSAPGTAFGLPTRGSFQSGRRLGDEVRYVLERRRLEAEVSAHLVLLAHMTCVHVRAILWLSYH